MPDSGMPRLFEHLIGQQEQRWRHRDPQRLGGLQIDHELELHGLLDREVGGLGTFQDLVYIVAGAKFATAEIFVI